MKNPSRSAAKLRAMHAPGMRGPHLLCFRCDSLVVGDRRCRHCNEVDMVAPCHRHLCGRCLSVVLVRRVAA
jgi:hypothetical protein